MESAQDCRATPLDRAMSALCQKRTLALEYEMPANIAVCTAAMTSPAAADHREANTSTHFELGEVSAS